MPFKSPTPLGFFFLRVGEFYKVTLGPKMRSVGVRGLHKVRKPDKAPGALHVLNKKSSIRNACSNAECYPLLSIVVHCCQLLSIVVHCCQLLSIVVHCCPLLSIVVHCCQLLSTSAFI